MMSLLAEILGVDIQKVMNDDKTHSDGIVELLTEAGHILLFLKEDKNESGDSACDPSMQAGLSAARHWAQDKVCVCYSLCPPLTIGC